MANIPPFSTHQSPAAADRHLISAPGYPAGSTANISSALIHQRNMENYPNVHNPNSVGPQIPAYASNESLNDLQSLRYRIRRHVDDIVRSMPLTETAAYLEAMQRGPRVVLRETDSLQFVRYEKYDVWKGARRLCRYWTERKRFFRERFHLPLVLTGDGALSKEDVFCLQAGYPAILPGTTPKGQRAVLYDRRKWLPNATAENKIRSLFYTWMMLSQDDLAQTEGVLCLVVLVTPKLQDLDWDFFHNVMQVSSSCIPIKSAFHLLNVPEQKKQFLVKDIMKMSCKIMADYFSASSINMHLQREEGEILKVLLDLGMKREHIPTFFGGTWKYEDGFEWLKEREQWEREQYQQPTDVTVTSTAASLHRKPSGENKKRAASDSTGDELSEEEKLAKRRMNDLLHSRRKRERKSQEFKVLKEESSELRTENHALKKERARLESLLVQAKAVVEQL